ATGSVHQSSVAENAYTAAYLFGIGAGSLPAGPLSETLGWNPTYLASTFCCLLFVLGSALTRSFTGQVVCQFFVGLCSSATLAVNGASVRDQFRPVKRAFVFPVVAWANVSAPVIAPICGGWIVSNPALTWRWTEWITLTILAAAFLVALLFLSETYLPILLDWEASHLRKTTGDNRYTSEHAHAEPFFRRMQKTVPPPAIWWGTEPVVAVLGADLVLLYSLLFLFLSGLDYIFKKAYNLSPGQTGSCFGAIAAGSTAFLVVAPGLYGWARSHTEHVRGRRLAPEFRLWPAIVTAPLLPVALLWLGWGNRPDVSLWYSLGACFVFGVVLIAVYVSSYEYIIDSYGDHAAVALASVMMVRYLVAGGVVMAARPMYEKLGVNWTMTLLGCAAAVLAPAPVLFWIYGPKLRKRSPYAHGPEDDPEEIQSRTTGVYSVVVKNAIVCRPSIYMSVA
ncbi:major facilitator superfamily domain-containing protein, partial [Lasiosphaeria hispida]